MIDTFNATITSFLIPPHTPSGSSYQDYNYDLVVDCLNLKEGLRPLSEQQAAELNYHRMLKQRRINLGCEY